MKKYLIISLTLAALIFAAGCNHDVEDVAVKNHNVTEPVQVTEQLLSQNNFENLSADIYLCDDVYRTAETPTHGSGTITLPMMKDGLIIEDYKIIRCDDGCDPVHVVSRASQGYALVYSVAADGELEGNFPILKFKMEVPAPMADELKEQGSYERIIGQIEREYYYLLVLDEEHYAYIALRGDENLQDSSEFADDIMKKATVQYESNPVKIELTLPKVRELAYRGDELTWDDFARYNSRDVGSGLYILKFELDETFYLLVGGVPAPGEKPMYVYLCLDAAPDKYIDIRTDDIEAFINETTLYFKTCDFLEKEFHRAFDSHYDIKSLTISNWNEDGDQATFFYKMTHTYYNRDPDTVGDIKKAKDEGSPNYEKMYNDYLAEKEANFEFKVVLNGSDLELYSNVSPKGVEWEPVKIDYYVLGNE